MKNYSIFCLKIIIFRALLPVENIMTVFSHIPDCLKASVTFFIASSITDIIPIHWKAAGIPFEYLCRRKCKFGNNKSWWKVVWWNNLSFPQSIHFYFVQTCICSACVVLNFMFIYVWLWSFNWIMSCWYWKIQEQRLKIVIIRIWSHIQWNGFYV